MANVIEATDPKATWAPMNMRTIAKVFGYGIIVGIITWVLYMILNKFVFEPILCRGSNALASCEARSGISSGIALIIGSIVGLVLLVRERVYRPMLAMLGIIVSFWTILAIVSAVPLFLALVITALLFGIAYVLFSWLVQPSNLIVSIVGVVVLTIIARLALSL